MILQLKDYDRITSGKLRGFSLLLVKQCRPSTASSLLEYKQWHTWLRDRCF